MCLLLNICSCIVVCFLEIFPVADAPNRTDFFCFREDKNCGGQFTRIVLEISGDGRKLKMLDLLASFGF